MRAADLKIEADERAWLDPEHGSKEAMLRIHERAGHPTTEICELTTEV